MEQQIKRHFKFKHKYIVNRTMDINVDRMHLALMMILTIVSGAAYILYTARVNEAYEAGFAREFQRPELEEDFTDDFKLTEPEEKSDDKRKYGTRSKEVEGWVLHQILPIQKVCGINFRR